MTLKPLLNHVRVFANMNYFALSLTSHDTLLNCFRCHALFPANVSLIEILLVKFVADSGLIYVIDCLKFITLICYLKPLCLSGEIHSRSSELHGKPVPVPLRAVLSVPNTDA